MLQTTRMIPFVLVGLAIIAFVLTRSSENKPAWLRQFKGWQKVFGIMAVVLAVLILINPELLALGLLGDTAFFDVLVLLLSLQLQSVAVRAWHGVCSFSSQLAEIVMLRLNRSYSLTILALVPFALTAALSTRAEETDAAKKDLAALQGEWSMVSGSADGQPMPDEMRKQMKRVCKDDVATTTMNGQMYIKAKVTLDPSKKPKTIDYEMLDGFTKGKKQLGIYEVEGDTFKACFGKPGGERPTDFTGKPGDGRTLSVWKREKVAAESK